MSRNTLFKERKMLGRFKIATVMACLVAIGNTLTTVEAAEYEIIAATQAPGNSPFKAGLQEFKELVEANTNGAVEVKIFVGGQLGNEPELFQAAIQGTVDVVIVSPGNIAEFVPQIAILEMPFVTTSHAQVERIIAGAPMAHLSKVLSEKTGTKIAAVFGGGTRNMFFKKPATGNNDLKGRRFRTQASKQLTDSYAALGLEPTVLSFSEMYGALQQGIIDGAEMESIYTESASFPEVAPHMLMTRHVVTIRPVIISGKTLKKLPDNIRTAVLDALEKAAAIERDIEKKSDAAALQRMQQKYNLKYTEVDVKPMIDAIRPVWKKYASEWGEESLLEQIESLR